MLDTKVGDAGLRHLRALTNLEELDLEGTKVTDAGMKDLEGLAKLRSLVLFRTRVTPEGENSLQKALPDCSVDRLK